MTEAVHMAGERVRSELISEGDRIKVYVIEVRRPLRGAAGRGFADASGLVKRLFSLRCRRFTTAPLI
jgi:N utilization substance protein A